MTYVVDKKISVAEAKVDPLKLNDFIQQNEKLIWHIIHTNFSFLSDHHDELLQLGRIAMYKAVKAYKSTEGQFTTFFGTCAINEINMWQRERRKYTEMIPLEEPIGNQNEDELITYKDLISDYENVEEHAITHMRVQEVFNNLKPHHRKAIFLACRGYSFKEVADLLGFSNSWSSRIYNTMAQELGISTGRNRLKTKSKDKGRKINE